MLRRALLLVALLAPLAALGQAINIQPPSPYTLAECTGSTNVTLNWSLPVGTTIPSGATYRIVVGTTSGCDTTSSALVVASDITPDTAGSDTTGATGQSYPKATDPALTLSAFATKASATCANGLKLYTCVQLMNGTTYLGARSDILTLAVVEGKPATPSGVTVAPGESALTVSWQDGSGGAVATSKFTARAYELVCDPRAASDPRSCLGAVVSSGTTSSTSTSMRLIGLTIGTTYGVDVTAYSETGEASDPSAVATGTPILTLDFWDSYLKAGGQEPGGCGGGPAGALSLLAVAGLVAALRRRP